MAEFCAVCSRRRTVAGGCSCAADTQRATQPTPVAAEPFAVATTRFDSRRHTARRTLVIAAVAVVLTSAAVTAGVLATELTRRPAPFAGASIGAPTPTSTAGLPRHHTSASALPAAGAVSIVDASASCTSAPGTDSAGNHFSYDGLKAIDGQLDSAWRCDHDGVGESLLLTLSRPAVVGWIGVVPGFAKTDPYDGTDRYLQCGRVASARFVFDDGTYVEHTFDVSAMSRSTQVVTFPPRATTRIQVIVLASVPGSPTNGQGATDKIAISEVIVGE